MSSNRNQNILLVEIMIAVLFFALCSGVILETFVASREYQTRSRIETEALVEMQNITEKVYAAQNAEDCLARNGFSLEDGIWTLDDGEMVFEMTLEREETSAGAIRKTVIRAIRDGKTIMEIPGARYLAGGETE